MTYWGWQGDKKRALEMPDGIQSEVSPEGRARLRYNDVTKLMEVSLDEAPYVPASAGPPTGPAGGDLAGTYPNPTIPHISLVNNPHLTSISNIVAGTLAQWNLKITDANLDDISASRTPNGAAGGDLAGTYPNPTIPHTLLTNNPHATSIVNIGSGTLAQLNTAITDANLDDSGDPRDPNAHNTSHQLAGSDAIKIDDLDTPDDNTDLNASTTRHGLLQKLPNDDELFLDGTGAFVEPPGAQVDVTFGFRSVITGAGTVYFGGFYDFATSANDFNPPVNFGTANVAIGAHVMLVCDTSPGTDTTIQVSGTSITDAGVRTAADTEDVTFLNGDAQDTYRETTKKWNGQVTLTKTAGNDRLCNYGFAKYWDNQNTNFALVGAEFTWFGAGNDAGADLLIYQHKATGWTYNAGAAPTPPTPVAQMSTTYGAERQVANNLPGAFKLVDMAVPVNGDDGQGLIAAAIQTAARPFDDGNLIVTVGESSPLIFPDVSLWLPSWKGVQYDDPAQMLADGDCEDSGTASWGSTQSTLSKVTDNPHSGDRALRITANAAPGAVNPQAQQIVLVIGKQYRLIAWVRSDGTQIPRITMGSIVFTGTSSTNWQPVDVTFVATSTTLRFYFSITGPLGSEFIDIDDCSLALTDSNLVSLWSDQTTNGRDVLQATENDKMSWASSGGPNGVPKVSADGINEYLRGTWVQGQPETVFFVVKPSVSSTHASATFADGATLNSSRFYNAAADTLRFFAGGAPLTRSCDLDVWHYITCVTNGATSSLSVDGGTAAAGNAGAGASNGLTLGATGGITLFADAEFAEIIRFDAVLSATQIEQVENYIRGWSGL